MIKVGDRVKFLSETLSGIVQSIDGDRAVVLTEDDFEVPALLSDLIVVDRTEEQRVKERIGYDQPRPGGGNRGAGRSAEQKKSTAKHERDVPRYGRITLEPEFDDEDELSEDYIIPAAFDPRVKDAVSEAVKKAAYETGVARL